MRFWRVRFGALGALAASALRRRQGLPPPSPHGTEGRIRDKLGECFEPARLPELFDYL